MMPSIGEWRVSYGHSYTGLLSSRKKKFAIKSSKYILRILNADGEVREDSLKSLDCSNYIISDKRQNYKH
jgi:hypothetical protein